MSEPNGPGLRRRRAAARGPRPRRAPRPAPRAVRHLAHGLPGRGLRADRRQRRGQVHAAADHRRPAPPDLGIDHLRRQGRDRAAAGEAGHRRDRDGPRGPAAVPVADPGGEPQGRRVLRAQGPVDHRAGLRAVPVDEGAARAEDRADVRRRAAVGRDRPRAGRQPPGAAARRAVPRPRAGDRAADLRHAAAGPRVRDHRPARRAGRQPGAARRHPPAVPARGAHHAGGHARRGHQGAGRGRLLRSQPTGATRYGLG